MSLQSSSSVNGEGSTPKDPLYKILDELRSLKLWKEKQERKEKGKKRVEEISQEERETEIYEKSTFPHIVLEYNLKRLHVFQIPSLEYFDIKKNSKSSHNDQKRKM